MAARCILTVNGGSSSIKFALIEATKKLRSVLRGRISGIGQPQGEFVVKAFVNGHQDVARKVKLPDHDAAVKLLMDWVAKEFKEGAVVAIGHRVVHGGPRYW